MDRDKIIDIIAAVPSDGPRGTVGHTTAGVIADAMDNAGLMFATKAEVSKPKHAKPGDG